MFATNWRTTKKSLRKAGPLWKVMCRTNTVSRKGFFKYPTQQSIRKAGPTISNEWIAGQLARLVELNTAETEWAEVDGHYGIVSIVPPVKRYFSWYQFYQQTKGKFIHKLVHPERLLDLLAFDMWICNLDRHSDNLIVYPCRNQYDFYLIDHGLSLLGAVAWRGVPWDSPYWFQVTRYNKHYPAGIVRMISSYQQFVPVINRILSIKPHQIAQIVDEVPDAFLLSDEKKMVKAILHSRQQNLSTILSVWLEQYKRIRSIPSAVCSQTDFDDYYYG
jgi:hypothetical protein